MTIYTSPYPKLDQIPSGNLTQFFLDSPYHAEHLGKTVLIDALSGQQLTVQQLHDAIVRFTPVLADKYGVTRNSVLCLSGLNSIWTPILHAGVLSLGAIVSPANIMYVPDELAHQLRSVKPVVAVAADFYEGVAEEAIKIAGVNTRLVRFSDIVKDIMAVMGDPNAKTAAPVEVDGLTQPAYYCFSSGTSGLPKGVITTHTNISANVLQELAADTSFLQQDAIIGAVLPMSHIYGLNVFGWATPYRATTAVVFPRFDLEELLASSSTYGVTVLILVPPIILLLGKHPVVDKYPIFMKNLRAIVNGAAPCSASTIALVEKRFPNVSVTQGFGLTETSPVTHVVGRSKDHLVDKGATGWLVSNMEARLVDPETGKDAAEGERGELWMRGPNVMAGYLHNKKATDETITPDGWLRTGDVAVIDKYGQFTIVDRIKELIKSKGHQVAPAELEGILLTNPNVLDAAVIGVADKDSGSELPRAYLQLKPDSDIHQVLSWFNKKVSKHKRLWGGAVAIEAVPKSPTGKILRRLLRDRKNDVAVGQDYAKL